MFVKHSIYERYIKTVFKTNGSTCFIRKLALTVVLRQNNSKQKAKLANKLYFRRKTKLEANKMENNVSQWRKVVELGNMMLVWSYRCVNR